MRRLRPLLAALCASLALLGAYVALGGGRYEPAAVADPCGSREWRDVSGLQEVLEQVVLRGLDGAACALGISREELVLGLRSDASLQALADKHGISLQRAEGAISDALAGAIDSAEQAGVLPGFVAGLVRSATEDLPPRLLLELLDRLRGVLG